MIAPTAAAAGYQAFLAGKAPAPERLGMPAPPRLASHLFDFQRHCVAFGLEAGCWGLFLDTGLGKTACELEWSTHAAEASNGLALILTPLAVAGQIAREAARWGYDARVIRRQAEAAPGINICNYDRLHLLDPDAFGAVALDESSILKNFTGATSRALRAAFAGHRWRMVATATPAPNDHMELGQSAEFLGVMPSNEMLMRWFVTDQTQMGRYRLKGHAAEAFWDWMASWSRMAAHPEDLGFEAAGYDLPPLRVVRHHVASDVRPPAGTLFAPTALAATEVHDIKRQTAADRASLVASLVAAEPAEPWVVWCDTDYEADALRAELRAVAADRLLEVRGSMDAELKERHLEAFAAGPPAVLVTKPSIAGFGLNWQHCARTVFAGRSHSYEAWYQAVRRFWRFGQAREVVVHLAVAEGEDAIGRVIDRKAEEHERMKRSMVAAMQRDRRRHETVKVAYEPTTAGSLPGWMPEGRVLSLGESHGRAFSIYHGDCVDVFRQLPDASVDLAVYSPPFAGLYIYSDSAADMGNSADDEEFLRHYRYLADELNRVLRPGRIAVIHCKDLVYYQNACGTAGLRDFPGEVLRVHLAAGFDYHSRVTVWRCPVREMTKTKARGLLYKQLRADSTYSRQGLPEYLLVLRRWAEGEEEQALARPVTHTPESFPLDRWQEWASPVWMDTRETDVLNAQHREPQDEKHICPLPLDLIERAITLWSAPGDVVASPFAGIGSEGYVALRLGRRFVGAELKEAYWRQAAEYLQSIDRQRGLFTEPS